MQQRKTSPARVIAIAELGAHNVSSDAWIALDGVVYDVTDFLGDHPGGPEILDDHFGTDATEAFTGDEFHQHSEAAKELLKGLPRIGVLPHHDGEGLVSLEKRGNAAEAQKLAEQLIDKSKPWTWQVGKLGKHYQQWVHTPIHTKEPIPLLGVHFGINWEFLTKCYWWVPLVFWIPAIIAMLVYTRVVLEWPHSKIWPVWLLSSMAWPFLEYFLHRVVYHMDTESYWANTAHFLFHGVHHLTPMDKTRLVAPPILAIIIATPLLILGQIFAPSAAFKWSLTAGLFSGYLVYDEIHYWLHHGNLPWEWLKMLKTHHMEHHYSVPDWNFGVSNTWTDDLFGTHYIRETASN